MKRSYFPLVAISIAISTTLGALYLLEICFRLAKCQAALEAEQDRKGT